MKKSKYQFFEEVNPGIYLHYNSLSNCFLLLKENIMYEKLSMSELKSGNPKFYKELVKKQFIIRDSINETDIVLKKKHDLIFDDKMYNVVINTTLDCNLNCWYCYENKIKGSHLQPEVCEAIKKNIALRYKIHPFKTLKMSFFGGEPFFYFNGVKNLLDYSKTFCENNGIELIADFTTNATLISSKRIEYLKQFRCHFQITLDG